MPWSLSFFLEPSLIVRAHEALRNADHNRDFPHVAVVFHVADDLHEAAARLGLETDALDVALDGRVDPVSFIEGHSSSAFQKSNTILRRSDFTRARAA